MTSTTLHCYNYREQDIMPDADNYTAPDEEQESEPRQEIKTLDDGARTLNPVQLFGVDMPVDKDFRPLPVDSADLEVSATAPKGLSVVESVDSSTTQEDLLTLMESQSNLEQSDLTVPAARVTGTPPLPVPSTPTSSEDQKAG